MDANKIPNRFFDLLSKDYDDLTSEEQKIVDDIMNSEEFSNLHSVVSQFGQADAALDGKLNTVKTPGTKKSLFHRVIHYPIPLYKLVASVLLCFGVYSVWNWPGQGSEMSIDGMSSENIGITVDEDSYPDDLIFDL